MPAAGCSSWVSRPMTRSLFSHLAKPSQLPLSIPSHEVRPAFATCIGLGPPRAD